MDLPGLLAKPIILLLSALALLASAVVFLMHVVIFVMVLLVMVHLLDVVLLVMVHLVVVHHVVVVLIATIVACLTKLLSQLHQLFSGIGFLSFLESSFSQHISVGFVFRSLLVSSSFNEILAQVVQNNLFSPCFVAS